VTADPLVCDIGCGRGTATLALAERLAPRQLIALDRSPALLAAVRDRAGRAGRTVETVCADFHQLPLPTGGVDVAVAAFCLYHSPRPEQVVAEIARCLGPGGHAVLVTKSADSYREIDQLITDTGLDPDAARRHSLYTSFHSAIAAEITATRLRVVQVVHQQHVFQFAGLEHLATYLTTTPKYQLPEHLSGDAAALAAELRRCAPDEPVIATSTVTYVTAARL
jgi:ubiquinone/menaquinone biosynthesis C-methylase UbiE